MENWEAHGHIVSDTPGRLRIRLRRTHRHPHVMELARNQLRQHEAVHQVATNDTTGSIVVNYDPARLSRDSVLGMLKDVGIIAREAAEELLAETPGESKHSAAALGIIAAVNDLDRRLSRATGRNIDLKLVFPASLFALGIRQAATQGLGLSTVPAYVLLWYAFDSFWKFHQAGPAALEAGQGRPGGSAVEERAGQTEADGRALTSKDN